MMKLDTDLYALLTHHLRGGKTDLAKVLAIMSKHIIMILQGISLSHEEKISLAEQVMSCVVDEIKKDPNPMARRLK